MSIGLEDLKNITEGKFNHDSLVDSLTPVQSSPVIRVQKIDSLGRAYSTGKRKTSIARVWIKPGSGSIVVNGKKYDEYFARPVLRMIVDQPLKVVDRDSGYDVWCTVKGGGISGQAGAVRHGISSALVNFEPELRALLKKGHFLTRDSREVERKK